MMESQSDLNTIRRVKREYSNRFFSYTNVVGSGVGYREVAGKRLDEQCIVVFVEHKRALRDLRADEIIPRTLRSADGEVLVDVVERARPRFAADAGTYRPVVGGCQIGTAAGGKGTVGAAVYDRTDLTVALLTCNHVITRAGNRWSVPADRIVQPADPILSKSNEIGYVKRIVPWVKIPNLGQTIWTASVDAGIVALDRSSARFKVIDIGAHPYVPLPPALGVRVRKRGASTGLTSGTITCYDMSMAMRDENGDLVIVGDGRHVFEIEADGPQFIADGDSGSLVVDANGAASRGLAFGSDPANPRLGYACALGPILNMLNLATPCTGAMDTVFWRALHRRWFLKKGLLQGLGGGDLQFGNVAKFRRAHLERAEPGSVGAAFEQVFQALAPELSEGIAFDEDFAGFLDLAIGDLIAQPTIFDMLEHKLPDDFADRLSRAFEHLASANPDMKRPEHLLADLRTCSGFSVREALRHPARV